MRRLSRRERVMAVGALVLGLGVLGYLSLVEPRWAAIQDLEQSRIPARERTLARTRARIAERAAIERATAATVEALAAHDARLLSGPTPPVAASELHQLLRALAGDAGLTIQSEQILKPVERGELLETPMEIMVSGRIRNLVTFLARLDGAAKLVVVRALAIRTTPTGPPGELWATVTVGGFLRLPRPRGG